jgi:hypothetical protein
MVATVVRAAARRKRLSAEKSEGGTDPDIPRDRWIAHSAFRLSLSTTSLQRQRISGEIKKY